MTRLIGKPDIPWLIGASVAGLMLAAALFLPLWRMELIAPQYPDGLAIWAFGNRFVGDTTGYYDGFDTLLEINNLNHYIGMKPIEEVWAMDLFVPGLILTILCAIAVSFVRWGSRWFQALMAAAFWVIPAFFLVVLQYYLWDFGHTMDPEAALSMDPFTPRVIGSTNVWNFHTVNSLQIGFYLMVLAAITITFLPIGIRWFQSRRARTSEKAAPTESSEPAEATESAAGATSARGAV